jgi:SAM-dependent methyltransferase
MDARDWDRRWTDKLLHAHGEPSSVVLEILEELEPGHALDLACGNGRHAMWLAERGWDVTAVDFSSEALRQAHERAAHEGLEVEWIEHDLVTYEPPRSAFDLVLVAYLHVPSHERGTILAAAATALSAGGTFVLAGHDLANIGTGAPGPSSPALLYTPDQIGAELPGLEVTRAEQVGRPVELENGSTVHAVDTLVVATRR